MASPLRARSEALVLWHVWGSWPANDLSGVFSKSQAGHLSSGPRLANR